MSPLLNYDPIKEIDDLKKSFKTMKVEEKMIINDDEKMKQLVRRMIVLGNKGYTYKMIAEDTGYQKRYLYNVSRTMRKLGVEIPIQSMGKTGKYNWKKIAAEIKQGK